MDSNACLEDIVYILHSLQNPGKYERPVNEERKLLADNLDNLSDWIRKGGFVPTLKIRILDR